jgi:LmbE family N-acetylglucosaminyl deacetylase
MLDKHQSSQPATAKIDPGERTRVRWWGAAGAIEARKTPRHGMPAIYDSAWRTAQMPVGEAFTAAATWIRKQRDKRREPASEVVSAILDRVGTPGAAASARRVVVVVAHPDDEAIGAGAVLRSFPDVTIVHVTDGAPLDDGYAQRKGFTTRDAYAEARRTEVVNALKVIGLPEERIRGLGIVDGEAAWHLVELCHKVADVFDELQPDVVLTHPYEGGHSDHDSTAFAVHLAAGMLLRDGRKAPIILELTSYHNYRGRRRLFNFLPFYGSRIRTIWLSAEDRRIKRKMFDEFTSQSALLQTFPIEVERFRQAPRYLFTVPPHEGQLDYERLCKKMTGAQWRTNAEQALEALRTRKHFPGM